LVKNKKACLVTQNPDNRGKGNRNDLMTPLERGPSPTIQNRLSAKKKKESDRGKPNPRHFRAAKSDRVLAKGETRKGHSPEHEKQHLVAKRLNAGGGKVGANAETATNKRKPAT